MLRRRKRKGATGTTRLGVSPRSSVALIDGLLVADIRSARNPNAARRPRNLRCFRAGDIKVPFARVIRCFNCSLARFPAGPGESTNCGDNRSFRSPGNAFSRTMKPRKCNRFSVHRGFSASPVIDGSPMKERRANRARISAAATAGGREREIP